MKKQYLLLLSVIFFFTGCSSEDIVKYPKVANKYDSSKPREITGFSPTIGEIGSKFLIHGNFGTDISKMKVLFNGDREATLISTDGISIYCVVPKQPGGENSVTVVADGETITTDKKFSYYLNQKVSTITGKYTVNEYVDGSIYDARFNAIVGINVVDEDNIVAVETHSSRVRLISLTENKVITLMTGLCTGKPAVNKARDKMYFVGLQGNVHKVYMLEKGNGWIPQKLRENIAELGDGELWSCALDKTEKYLYARSHKGVFVRMSLEENGDDGQLKVEKLLDIKPNTTDAWCMLVYSAVDDCFYASQRAENGIYKIWCDASGVWQQAAYAGFNRSGTADGEKTAEAQFNEPFGMTVDSYGDLYVAETYNWLIRKVSRVDPQTGSGGYVTTVAGQYRKENDVDGLPLESTFHSPHDIAVDSEDNFYIAEDNGRVIRKLAIE